MRQLKKLYQETELGLGIKPHLNAFFGWLGKLLKEINKLIKNLLVFLDKRFLFPLYESLRKYFYRRVVDHYGADYHWNDQLSQNLDKNTHNYGYGELHYSLIRNQRPRNILCIGSMYGYVPYMMAKACHDNQGGQVYFVDAGYDIDKDRDKNHFFGQGFWKKDSAEQHFSYLLPNHNKWLSLHVMTAVEFIEKNPRLKFDYVFFDGDHTYRGVKRDLRKIWPKINNGGLAIFHDVDYDRADSVVNIEMKKFWQEMIGNEKYAEKIKLSNEYSGLGVVRKIK